jgi:hypothetical protein
MSEDKKDISFLEFFARDYLPGILIIVLIMLVISSIDVKGVTVKSDKPLEPASIEISSKGDTTYHYYINMDNDEKDTVNRNTLNITLFE